MKRYNGNQTVDEGIYLNTKSLEFTSMDERGPLPGIEKDEYVRVPVLMVLPLAAAISLGYVIFLPLVGFVMVGGAVARTAAHAGAEAGEAMARVMRPAWQPARAFLSRHRHEEKHEEADDEWAEAVDRELAGKDDERPAA